MRYCRIPSGQRCQPYNFYINCQGGRGFYSYYRCMVIPNLMLRNDSGTFFLVFMGKGAIQIASQFNLNENASDVITGIILFFILGSEFFIRYRIAFTKAHK